MLLASFTQSRDNNTVEITEYFFIRVKNEKRAGLLPRDIL